MLEWLKILVALSETLIWPLLVVGLVFWLRDPIRRAADKIVRLQVGSFAVELRKRVRQAGDPSIEKALLSITPNAVKTLLRADPRGAATSLVYTTGRGSEPIQLLAVPTKDELQALAELTDRGLVEISNHTFQGHGLSPLSGDY